MLIFTFVITLTLTIFATLDLGSKDGHVTKYQNFENSKWRTSTILKIVFWLHLNDLLSNKREIWYEEAELRSDTGHVTKLPILKMVSSLYLSCRSSNFNEIWYAAAEFGSKNGQLLKVSKFCKIKMANGRFVCEQLYVGLQISWVLWVNRRCPPILIVVQG